MKIRNVEAKSPSAMALEWDALARTRFEQITNGEDLSYINVISPTVVSLASPKFGQNILDAGCGVGVLTSKMANYGANLTGIDPSASSIELASMHHPNVRNFYATSMEDFSKTNPRAFDTVVANMVLMDVLNLEEFLHAASQVLKPSGRLIFSCTHPCFWPSYRGYDQEEWFRYSSEIIIEAPFVISTNETTNLYSTHIHRPIERYFLAMEQAGLRLEKFLEPMPSSDVDALYPRSWVTPRYLFGAAVKA